MACSGMAPMNSESSLPSRNALTAGMLWMRNAIDAWGLASVSSLASRKSPPCCSASRSSTGPIIRHGWHQSAQKSTTTGRRKDSSSTSRWKVASVRTVADVAATVRREMPVDRPRIPPGTGKYQQVTKRIAGWFFRWYCRMKVTGTEHIPSTGPVILAANHRSMWDVPIHVIACPRPITFMAKAELYRYRFLAWAWRVLGGFPVRREINDIRAIDTGLAVLERDEVLCLYPEGTRSKTGEMLPFLKGTAWIALKTGAPIVPCGLKGTGRVPPPGTKKPRFGKRVEVNFGQPIAVIREDDHRMRKEKAEALTSELLAAISSLSS